MFSSTGCPRLGGACTSQSMSHGARGGSIGRADDAEQQTAGDTDATQAWEWDIRKRPCQDSSAARGRQRPTSPSTVVTGSDLCGWWAAWEAPSHSAGRSSCPYIIATLLPPLARKRSDARGLIDRRGFAAKWPFLSISACRTSHCMRACILAHYHLRARFSSSSFCTLILSRALGRHIAGDRVI